MRCPGISDELAFLIDRGHLHVNRDAPVVLSTFHRFQVFWALFDDTARVTQIARCGIVAVAAGNNQ